MMDSHSDPCGVGHPDEARLRQLIDMWRGIADLSSVRAVAGAKYQCADDLEALLVRQPVPPPGAVRQDTMAHPSNVPRLHRPSTNGAAWANCHDCSTATWCSRFELCLSETHADEHREIQRVPPPGVVPADEMIRVLRELTEACESDMCSIDTDTYPDDESVGGGLDGDCAVTFGMIRRARKMLNSIPAVPAAQDARPARRWTEVLCQKCGGNGVIKIPGGISVCPRCDGRCYEPEALRASHPSRQGCITCGEDDALSPTFSVWEGPGPFCGSCWDKLMNCFTVPHPSRQEPPHEQ